VTGIYEHREVKGWKNKIPYYVGLRDRAMFCIPGLYHYNTKAPSDPETGEVQGMFTAITRAANGVMRQIHNSGDNAYRMPLFLPRELEFRWLDPALSEEGMAEILSYVMPEDQMVYNTVYSIRGRTPRPDGLAKCEVFEYAGLPPLGNDDGEVQKTLF
jgi:putative SOS response-associated peptidase YedK